nr:MAG TPA: hypothetical protein [Caudoviricetes sp.]
MPETKPDKKRKLRKHFCFRSFYNCQKVLLFDKGVSCVLPGL